ncbi:hypothetical protein GDO78_018163 [Eleutherodactylus coqui]|uniref:Uncharacterized protein n=1 Tax=Eleutherodactylus coqui TaxID=57060 RepID=A0A8J6C7C8_ELECQ|nr:hypothetical protein GDO78_018163 [Eleutherodactylus coqui]
MSADELKRVAPLHLLGYSAHITWRSDCLLQDINAEEVRLVISSIYNPQVDRGQPSRHLTDPFKTKNWYEIPFKVDAGAKKVGTVSKHDALSSDG